MISGTNQSKNTVSPFGQVKGYARQAVYGIGIYGLAIYGVGVSGFGVKTNQSKSTVPATTIPAGSAMGLLLTLTYANAVTVGSGVTNQSKS